jgi:hypothetical protein
MLEEVWQDVGPSTGQRYVENADLLKQPDRPNNAQYYSRPEEKLTTVVQQAPLEDVVIRQPDSGRTAALENRIQELMDTIEHLKSENQHQDRRLKARTNETIMFFLTGAALIFVLDSFANH